MKWIFIFAILKGGQQIEFDNKDACLKALESEIRALCESHPVACNFGGKYETLNKEFMPRCLNSDTGETIYAYKKDEE